MTDEYQIGGTTFAEDSNGNIVISGDDLDIAGSDLVASGDFLAVGDDHHAMTRTFSTTSTSYTSDTSQFDWQTQWDQWAPSGAQTAVLSRYRLEGTAGDVRLRNVSDSENVFEDLDVSAGTSKMKAPINYQPTTTGSLIAIRFQIRSNDGTSSSDLVFPRASTGVQL